MAQVDRLIAAKDYPAAIRFLTERIRLKDEKFDKYQDRLRQILLRMNNYTVVANILLDLLEKDPEGDLEQILALSRQLSEMNSVRDENTANYFDNIEVVARFTVNRRILERILREGRAFLDQGQFLAALRKYQTGLDLYQAEMFRDNFGDDINSQTRSNFLEINNIISTISPLIDTFLAARTNVMSQDATDNNRAAFAAAYNRLVPQLDRLVQAKQIMTSASDFWRNENNKNESAGNKKEGRYFFSMAPVFINGRSDQQIREGMLGALDGIWRTAIDPIENSFEKISEDIYNNALSNAENGNYSASHSEIERAISFNATPLALIAKWDSFTRPDKMPDQNLLGQNVDAARLDEFLRYTSMDASLEYLDTADTLGSRFATELNRRDSSDTLKAWQAGSLSSTDALTRERQIRTVYKEIAVDITKALTSNDADAKKYSALGTAKDSSRYFGNSRRVLENIGLGIYTAELNSAERIYTIANAALSKKADELEKDFDDANRFASGTPFKLASGEQITAKYPREALGIWEKDQADLDKAIADVSDLLKEHQNELSSFANNGDIVKLRTEAGAISNRLNAMRRKESTSITLARASLTTADNQKKQAEQFIQNARRELDKNNFDAAHEQVERAATAFNSSLSYQEDEVVRRALDDRLVPLNAEITRAQYVYTEREVENLINSARNTYFDGNFDAAEERLVRAEERWSTISTGGNEELNYWLTIVRGALSL
ncbi:MAG: YfdX family protein, partial [Spirochaetaceae bacterium]|nr:YfdX family protein [Spirochaetaceae bacterium]